MIGEEARHLAMVAASSFAIYVFLVLALSTLGRRQRAQLTTIDLVVMLLLGSAVETAMVAGSSSFKVGIVSATTLLVTNRLFSLLSQRSATVASLIDNPPLVLVKDGVPIEPNLQIASLTLEDLKAALRGRGEQDLATVHYMMLEADGQISVVERVKQPQS